MDSDLFEFCPAFEQLGPSFTLDFCGFADVQCGTAKWYWLVENPATYRSGI